MFRFRTRHLLIKREITRSTFETCMAPDPAGIDEAVGRALIAVGIGADAIGPVFLTGGTSLMPTVRRLFAQRFDEVRIAAGGDFVSIAGGQALMAATR